VRKLHLKYRLILHERCQLPPQSLCQQQVCLPWCVLQSQGKVALCRNHAVQEFTSFGVFQEQRFYPCPRLALHHIHGRHMLVEFVFFPREFLQESRDFATHA